MLEFIKLILAPAKFLWILGLILGLGMASGNVTIPGASAQELDCQGEIINNECVPNERVDICWNLDDIQTEVPPGYFIDQNQNNACIEVETSTQVLSETTEAPKVLAETTESGK